MKNAGPKIPILMYHSISNEAEQPFKKFVVSPARFEEHLVYLKQQNYTPLTVSQYLKAITGPEPDLPFRPVVLTFDDGFADFYTEALPALNRHSFTATLYITTGLVGESSRWLHSIGVRRPMLSWTSLREISASGIECGAHSHTHPQLDVMPLSHAYDEITRPKNLLEEKLGQEVSSFAFPFGYYNAVVRQMVQKVGYTSACAVRYSLSSPQDDLFALSRLIVTGQTSVAELATILTRGNPKVVPAIKRVVNPVWYAVRRGKARLKDYQQRRGV